MRCDAEGETPGEIGLDRTGDDACRRSLRRDDGVDADGARLLSQACDWQLDLLPRSQQQVAVLIDDQDDVGQEAVTILGV